MKFKQIKPNPKKSLLRTVLDNHKNVALYSTALTSILLSLHHKDRVVLTSVELPKADRQTLDIIFEMIDKLKQENATLNIASKQESEI